MSELLDRKTLRSAFEALGQHLVARGAFVELAVYGGSAIMLQFEWRLSTTDVDAVVREGFDQVVLTQSAQAVAAQLCLDPDWLNNAVGMFTPLHEEDTLFEFAGSYPAASHPGLRILLARPHYLLAMKLQALANLDRGNKDIADARALAHHLHISDVDELYRLYVSIHDDQPPAEARLRFGTVLEP